MDNSLIKSREFIELRQELKSIKKFLISNKEVLSLEDLSIYTGFSKSTIYELTSQSKIPHYKPNVKKIFFDREEVNSWLKQNKVCTEDSILNSFQF